MAAIQMRTLEPGSSSGEGEKRTNSVFILGRERTSAWRAKLEGIQVGLKR